MAKNDTGKWVSRAAATGGSRTYGSRRPANYYLAVALVVVLGLASIALARSSYRNPSTKSTEQPAVGKTWYAGYAISVCGQAQAPLPANQTSATGQTTPGQGVVKITPSSQADAGAGATVGKFVNGYQGFIVRPSVIVIPGTKPATYRAGQACPAGTPEAGSKGVVKVTYWPTITTKKGKDITSSFEQQRWGQNALVTFSFGAAKAKVARPSSTTIAAMLQGVSTTTSIGTVTPTSSPSPVTVPLTVPATSTTKP